MIFTTVNIEHKLFPSLGYYMCQNLINIMLVPSLSPWAKFL